MLPAGSPSPGRIYAQPLHWSLPSLRAQTDPYYKTLPLPEMDHGVGDAQNNVTAKSINFDSEDLEMSEAIQAGLTPTKQAVATNAQNIQTNQKNIQTNSQEIAANQVQTAANKQQIAANQEQIDADQQKIQAKTKRFSELSEYDTKADISVNFAVGSSAISADDKAALSKLAHDAVISTGYIISVKGFADSSGNAAMNQKLSMDRAQEVIAYLIQDCQRPRSARRGAGSDGNS